MSEALFFYARHADGRYAGRQVALENAFYAGSLNREIASGAYPALERVWRYEATLVGASGIMDLFVEVHRLAESENESLQDDSVLLEMKELEECLRFAADRGLEVLVSGP